MATFHYLAKDQEGKTEKGVLEAADKEAFLRKIREKGLYCIQYRQERTKEKVVKSAKLTMKQLVIISRQFATMLESGVSLIKCIDILYQQEENKKLKGVLLKVYEEVQRGNALSVALLAQGKTFPNLFISMVECGEESGTLDETLKRMADHYEKENKLQNKVKNAMIYPAILGVVSVGVVIILLVGVVPTFAEMFADFGELPAITQILVDASNYIRTKWFNVIIGVLLIGIAFYFALKTTAFRRWFDKTKLTCPKIGELNKIIMSARFAETTATLYASGMSLMDVMDITQRVLNNTYINQGFEKAKEDVKKGVALSQSMQQIGIFPAMLPNMILIGEESGQLEEVLEKTAQYYQEEADAAVQKMVALLEPIMILFLGGIIALIVGAILPPMYEMMGNIQ